MNVRMVRTMTSARAREYRLILIMESGAGETLNFPAGVCLSLFFFPRSLPVPLDSAPWVPAISISRHLFTFLPLLFSPEPLFRPVSLFNIDFLSKGRKYREYRVTRALSNLVVCFALWGTRMRRVHHPCSYNKRR